MVLQVVVNGLIAGSAYALIALSFGLIYGATRFFHFSHAAVFTWGAYVSYACYVLLGLPFWVSAGLGAAMSTTLGIGLEVGIYRPMRRRGATSIVLLLVSLGLYVVLQNSISLLFGDDTKTVRVGLAQTLVFLGARITSVQLLNVVTSAALIVLTWAMLAFTKFGMELRAVASDRELALVTGIQADRAVLGAFALGSFLAGVAAILVSLDVDMNPVMGMNALMMGVVTLIIGGVGSITGTALGALLLGLAQHLGVWWVGSQWQDTIAFLILIGFLLIRPQGFSGRPLRKAAV